MSTRLIVPPAALAVSMEAARLMVRVDVDENGKSALDVEIEQAIRTYTTEAEGEINRAIIEQTWRVKLDSFPDAIQLQNPPILAVEHVKFRDSSSGDWQQLDPQDYEVDDDSEPGYVVPAPGRTWPLAARRILAVEVLYRCGYGPDHTSVPDGIKGFILARVQEHFETNGQPKNEYVKRLLWPYKVYL
jgi:uncharacterized phiE125 gp8 family phage protein